MGYAGVAVDKVGPGDYDIEKAKGLISRNTIGVTPWKVEKEHPKAIQNLLKEYHKHPGPGEYLKLNDKNELEKIIMGM